MILLICCSLDCNLLEIASDVYRMHKEQFDVNKELLYGCVPSGELNNLVKRLLVCIYSTSHFNVILAQLTRGEKSTCRGAFPHF